jgi:hypothetical protein
MVGTDARKIERTDAIFQRSNTRPIKASDNRPAGGRAKGTGRYTQFARQGIAQACLALAPEIIVPQHGNRLSHVKLGPILEWRSSYYDCRQHAIFSGVLRLYG